MFERCPGECRAMLVLLPFGPRLNLVTLGRGPGECRAMLVLLPRAVSAVGMASSYPGECRAMLVLLRCWVARPGRPGECRAMLVLLPGASGPL